MVDDRAGNQMWEDSHELTVGQEGLIPGLSAIGIDQIGRLGEGKEGDTQWQDNMWQVKPVRTSYCIHRAEEEVRILEVPQQRDVNDDAKNQPAFTRGCLWHILVDGSALRDFVPSCQRLQMPAYPIVKADGGCQQRHVVIVPPAIKEKRRQYQPKCPILTPFPAHEEKADNR